MKKFYIILKAVIWSILVVALAATVVITVGYCSHAVIGWMFQKDTPYEETREVWLPKQYTVLGEHEDIDKIRPSIKWIYAQGSEGSMDMEAFKQLFDGGEIFVKAFSGSSAKVHYFGVRNGVAMWSSQTFACKAGAGFLTANKVSLEENQLHIKWDSESASGRTPAFVVGGLGLLVLLSAGVFGFFLVYAFLFSPWNPWEKTDCGRWVIRDLPKRPEHTIWSFGSDR